MSVGIGGSSFMDGDTLKIGSVEYTIKKLFDKTYLLISKPDNSIADLMN